MSEKQQPEAWLREELLREYLKAHPGVSRSQIVSRFKNGMVVFDTIDNVVGSISSQISRKQARDLLAKEQAVSTDERYQSCKISIRSCKDLVEFLFSRSFAGVTQLEKNDHINFLNQHEKMAVHHIHALHEIRKEFSEMLQADRSPSRSKTHDTVCRYTHGVLDQIKCQNRIYKREITLGNKLAVSAREFIKDNVPSVKSHLKLETRQKIATMYTLAKTLSGQTVIKAAEPNVQALEDALTETEAVLEKRRIQIEALEKVIEFVEKILEKIAQEIKEDSQPEKEPPKGKSLRMAFTTKRGSRR
ncbi:MAG: hypothetical protein ABIH23_18925 [bacterium]